MTVWHFRRPPGSTCVCCKAPLPEIDPFDAYLDSDESKEDLEALGTPAVPEPIDGGACG